MPIRRLSRSPGRAFTDLCASLYLTLQPITRRLKRFSVVHRILRPISHWLLPLDASVWALVRGGAGRGLWLRLQPRYEATFWRGEWEPEVQEGLAGCLERGHVLYDVGAHMGFFSLLAARQVGPEGAVYAFEPDPRNSDRIAAAAARNGFRWLHVVRKAAWETVGSMQFVATGTRSGSMTGTLAAVQGGATAEAIEVETLTLDHHCEMSRPPTVLKIDVEGAEVQVLRGAADTLRRYKPIVLLEVHHPQLLDSVRNLLAGYAMKQLGSDTQRYPSHFLATSY